MQQVLNAVAPDPGSALPGRTPWDVLVAAILSEDAPALQAQASVAWLAEHHATMQAVAALDHRWLAQRVRPLRHYTRKARAVVEAARALMRDHHASVPPDPELLARVPGVGRVVASVVVDALFGIAAISANRAVCRVVSRWGWAESSGDPRQVSAALARAVPSGQWAACCRQITVFASAYCTRAAPRCAHCPCAGECPAAVR